MCEGEGEVLSINPIIGQEKKEKRTIDKTLVVENSDKVKNSIAQKARNEGSIVGQGALVADQELGKTELS